MVALLSLGAQGIEIVIFGKGETWNTALVAVPMLYSAIGAVARLPAWEREFLADLAWA